MREIIFEWNPWWDEKYDFKGIKRDKLNEVIPWIKRKEIISITGVRRSGKTTLMFEIIEHLIKKEQIPSKNIFFIKADDDRIDTDRLIDNALDEYYQLKNPESKIFVFIDEIQEIDKWQKTLKRIYDLKENIKLFISGSNASVIKEELSTLLSGRCAYFEVFPFNFNEFLKSKGLSIESEREIIKQKNKIRHFLLEYLNGGGFPEVVLEDNTKTKKELIGYYFDSIFYRDIIKRRKIRNPQKLEKLVKYYLQNISNLANFTKIAKLLELTTDSVVEYTKALEDAYLIFNINLFEFSYKKQIVNPKKIYSVDIGIRNNIGFKFSEDIGRIYENIVFLQLRRKYKEIFYYKGKNECDFIIKKGKILDTIQVCYNLSNEKTKEREIKGLLEAMDKFKIKNGIIITNNYDADEKINKKTIKFIPLWKWLLEK